MKLAIPTTLVHIAITVVTTYAFLRPTESATSIASEKADQRLSIAVTTAAQGSDDFDWTQARTAFVPGAKPHWITTMSRTEKVGAHGYRDVFASISRDGGKTWTRPEAIPSLRRAKQPDSYEVVAGDLWPKWHPTTGKVLVTGKTFNFADGTKENFLREKISYAVIDPETGQCGPLRTV